jgi:phosphatidate cytidylyltransferase
MVGRAADVTVGSELRTRIVAAGVLAPLVLGLVWLGGLAFAALVMLAAIVMAYEWQALMADSSAVTISAAVVGAIGLMTFAEPLFALLPLLFAAILITRSGARLSALGPVYVGLPCLALIWLRQQPETGLASVVWLLAVVWATDVGAYAFGRALGGPRLASRLSSAKTWAGLLGGMVLAAVAGVAVAAVLGLSPAVRAVLTAAGLAVLAQVGDLFESWLKRRRGVKDSGSLIPGHGGLLDRVDGMMIATPALALLLLVANGEARSW